MASGIQQTNRGPVIARDEPIETKYLDLDDDGLPDAVRTTNTRNYDGGGADVVRETGELDAGIGPDGVPTTVVLTETVLTGADHEGAPGSAEVTTLTVHPTAESDVAETEYLDLDDDGLPDAVRTTETRSYDGGGADVVKETSELDAGIGPDGVPTTVTVTETVTTCGSRPPG